MNSPLTAHLTRQALSLEQVATSIEQGVVEPDDVSSALELLRLAAEHLLTAARS